MILFSGEGSQGGKEKRDVKETNINYTELSEPGPICAHSCEYLLSVHNVLSTLQRDGPLA